MSIWLAVFLAFVAVLAGVAVRGLGPASESDVDRWIDRHGLDVGREGRAFAVLYLSWVRPWRTAGLVLGLLPFSKWIVYDTMDQAEPWPAFWLGLAAAGYLGGCVIGEITFRAVSRGASGEAELKPREPSTYLPGSMTVLPWGVTVLALLLLPAYLLVSDPARVGGRLAGVIWCSGLIILTAASVRVAMGRVIDRPRPVASSDLLRVDHAARSSSLRRIVLAGVALQLFLVSVLVSEIGRALEARPQHGYVEAVSWLTACVVVLAVVAWISGASDRTPSSLVRRASA
ncbi:MAG TPA: hypothetical protein VF108_07295 [Actinomycetota bacterium]